MNFGKNKKHVTRNRKIQLSIKWSHKRKKARNKKQETGNKEHIVE